MRSFQSLCRGWCVLAVLSVLPTLAHAGGSFIGTLKVKHVAPTVPENGDVNPYGVAVVPATTGGLN